MILGFKDQFVPMVLAGSKTHTIRAGDRWKTGMRADLFAESRRRKVFELRLSEAPGCICHGDGLMGMECRAPVHAEYRQVQVAGMRLLFRATVTKTEIIEIRTALPLGPWITINGEPLNEDEADMFAWRDGFRHYFNGHPSEGLGYGGCFAMMMEFWRGRLPFVGQIIHWDFEQRYIPCGDCGRSHPLGPCNAMVRSDWRLPRPGEMERVLCAR